MASVLPIVFSLLPLVESVSQLRIALALSWWAVLLLYDPVCVSLFGATVGHRVMNLRVVNDRTGGKLSLPAAIARFWIKAVLGVISFFTMHFDPRHRAVHDMATRSSVRIADPSRAQPHHFTTGQPSAPSGAS